MPLEKVQVVVLASVRDKLGIKNTQMGCYSAPLFSNVKFEKEAPKSQNRVVAIPDAFLKTIFFVPKYILSYVFQSIILKTPLLKKGFFSFLSVVSAMKSKKTYNNGYTNLSESEIWNLAEQETLSMHKSIADNMEMKFEPDDFFVDLINSNFDFGNNTPTNFCLSNYGIMNNTKNANVIKLNEHYVSVPCIENRFGAVLQFGVSTVDNNLNIGICFNEKIFSVQFVKDLKKDLLEKIETLSE